MTDIKPIAGALERQTAVRTEPHDVDAFARRHGISTAEARRLLEEAGPDRSDAEALLTRQARS